MNEPMNSCLYECTVMHNRLEPKKHRFAYKVFMFYLDLAEIDTVAGRLKFFSHNRRNLFSFLDTDHLQRGAATVRENILDYLRSNQMTTPVGRIMLLSHLRTFGHIFNPVSFYYCFDENDQPLCVVSEVVNTFREMKPYFLGIDTLKDGLFQREVAKNFYVSPFIDLDASFHFRLGMPGARLAVYIDDYAKGRKIFLSSLTGERRALSDAQLAWYTLRFPLITVQVIALIHWQAFRLWLKGLRYHRKSDHPELQQEVYNAKRTA